jgi:hypothetical protein
VAVASLALTPLTALAEGAGEPAPPVVSLLAVGDTGEPARLPGLLDTRMVVGTAMGAEHAKAPVAALVLLGDNFYPHGLEWAQLVERIRGNVVLPFCAFVALDGPDSQQLGDACAGSRGDGPRPHILALLGNHDVKSSESEFLERAAVPRFVSNWRVPDGPVEVVELPGGLSLVLFDSVAVARGAAATPLRDALARARGRFRVVAGHHPIALVKRPESERAGPERRYREVVQEAIAASGRTVHAFLAGHAHSLQAIAGDPAGVALHVVAGSGSEAQRVRTTDPGLRFAAASPGFARLDLVRTPAGERLVVSLFTTESHALVDAALRLAARFSVDEAGRLTE